MSIRQSWVKPIGQVEANEAAEHQRRQAYIYIRQSMLRQVSEHLESQDLQYQLVERAQSLGWGAEQIEIIDEDLGKSGISRQERSGFERLYTDVGLGKVGLILVTNVSRLAPNATLIQALCEITGSGEAKFQTAATWLLKRFQENGLSFSPNQVEACLALLDQVTYWEAKLHLLQMLPEFVIPAHRKHTLHQVLMEQLNQDNKFVRAWSYNGLAELATQYPEFRIAVADLLQTGQATEAASIKARIRHLRKTKPWTNTP